MKTHHRPLVLALGALVAACEGGLGDAACAGPDACAAGSTASAPLGLDLVLDHPDATLAGAWRTKSKDCDAYAYSSSPDSSATYAPSLSGTFEVSVFDPGPQSLENDAQRWTVRHADGATTVAVDMSAGGCVWRSLGTFELDTTSTVVTDPSGARRSELTLASKVRFVAVGAGGGAPDAGTPGAPPRDAGRPDAGTAAPSDAGVRPGTDAGVPSGRPRVIVSTDIGGCDPDDFQSMVHYLVYADRFDTEGLIASPPCGGDLDDLLEAIDAYEADYAALSRFPGYPTPSELRSVSVQGATSPARGDGTTTPTDGSRLLIERANADDPRPLYVLVWGSITDVAQAVHDDPSIASKIRIYSIGSWNTAQDEAARDYLYDNHRDTLWWIESDTTFRGMYMCGDQSGDLSNESFPEAHVAGHGALGDLFMDKKAELKMGDTPSVLYLLTGDPSDPTDDHWGGSFARPDASETYWTDRTDRDCRSRNGALTVSDWRVAYLRDWQGRMDRTLR